MRQSRPHHRHNLSHTVVRNSMCVTTYVQWLYKDLENPVTITPPKLSLYNQTLYKPNSPVNNLLYYSGQYIFRYKFVLTCFSGTVNMHSYQCRTITFCVRFLALPECVVYLLACGHNVQCQTFQRLHVICINYSIIGVWIGHIKISRWDAKQRLVNSWNLGIHAIKFQIVHGCDRRLQEWPTRDVTALQSWRDLRLW